MSYIPPMEPGLSGDFVETSQKVKEAATNYGQVALWALGGAALVYGLVLTRRGYRAAHRGYQTARDRLREVAKYRLRLVKKEN